MTDALIMQIVTAVIAFCSTTVATLVTAYVGLQITKLNRDQKLRAEVDETRAVAAAAQVDQVKESLDISTRKAAERVDLVKKTLDANQKEAANLVVVVADTLSTISSAAAEKVAEVKSTLDKGNDITARKLEDLSTLAHSTHQLVNSAMSNQLKITAIALGRIATMTGDPKDQDTAKLAENAYQEHLSKQQIIDEQAAAGNKGVTLSATILNVPNPPDAAAKPNEPKPNQ